MHLTLPFFANLFLASSDTEGAVDITNLEVKDVSYAQELIIDHTNITTSLILKYVPFIHILLHSYLGLLLL